MPRSPWIAAVLLAGIFVTAIDLTIVASALPDINSGLHARINWTGWVITAYGLCTVIALPLAGRLSARLGPRRVFVAGLVLFTGSSVLCGLATNVYVLIGWRAVQAMGGGALQPAAAGLIGGLFDADMRKRLLSLFGVVSAAGQLLGPLIGGILVDLLSWRWIFFVNVPIGVLVVAVCLTMIPRVPATGVVPTSPTGLALMVISVTGLLLAITNLGSRSGTWSSLPVLGPALPGLIALVGFAIHEARGRHPFIPRQLLYGAGFVEMNVINLLHGVVTFGIMSLVPLYAEQRYGMQPVPAGSLLTIRAVGMLVSGTPAAFMLRRTGYRWPMWIGFSLVGVGAILISLAAPSWFGGPHPYVWLVACLTVSGLGLGLVNPAASNAGVDLAPEAIAAITGLRFMFINIGVILSVSITTAVISRSATPVAAQQHVFWGAAAIVGLVLLPVIGRIPSGRRVTTG